MSHVTRMNASQDIQGVLHTHTHTHTHTQTHTLHTISAEGLLWIWYVFICVYKSYVCVYANMCAYTYICIYICVYICIYICVYICIYIYIFMCVCLNTHTNIGIQNKTNTYRYA